MAFTYYVKLTGSTGDGKSIGAAWSPAFYNSTGAALVAHGDTVLLEAGAVYPPLNFPVSGISGDVITYGSYGTGAKPRISGLTTLTFNINEGNGIWSAPFSAQPSIAVATLDDVMVEMGRYPRETWSTYEGHSGDLQITDSSLLGSPSWNTAEVVIRISRYIINRYTVTSHSGGTLTYNTTNGGMGGNAGTPTNLNGYFFQNHINTLSTTINPSVNIGDWFYNASTSKFYMYFGGGTPSGKVIKVNNVNITTNLTNVSYVTFNNIVFEGGRQYSMYAVNANHIIFNSCEWLNSGGFAANISASTYIDLNNCNIDEAGACGFYLIADNCTLTNNIINKIFMFEGMGNNGDGTGNGLVMAGNNNTISRVSITNIGFNGIDFSGSNFLLEKFYINGVTYCKDDGGGIYSYDNQDTNRIIRDGIIVNAQSALEGGRGDTSSLYGKGAGIYMDDLMANVDISNVFIAHCDGPGVFWHGAHDIDLINCTVYDCRILTVFEEWMPGLIYNNTRTGNKFICKTADQLAAFYHCYGSTDFGDYGISNSNKYSRPLGTTALITTLLDGISSQEYITLATWKTRTEEDLLSSMSPLVVSSESDWRYDINPTNVTVTKSLPSGIWKDISNTSFQTGFPLSAWAGKVLAYSGPSTGGGGGKKPKTASGQFLVDNSGRIVAS